ncbi:MAG: beta-lactamase family protein [Candidatus Eremiobacteraeota bacterium]|nr:beta-lactamase family protein [Candidatus Eremiobacteraeota bacterium]
MPPPAPPPSGGVAAIDQIVAQNYAGGWGVELAIYKNGVPLYIHGYGMRDRGLPDSFGGPNIWRVPQPDTLYNLPRGQFAPDATTLFDLASVSKSITAGAILLLQQDGKLSVNDPLSKYFPTIPSATQIPLLYLLQQRSGIEDYTVNPSFGAAYRTFLASGNTDYQAIIDMIASYPLHFTPGTQYEYDNSNYLLLGLIVAKVSGEPFGTFLQQRIFGPLGMTQTTQALPPPPISDIALGYGNFGGVPQRMYQANLAWTLGAGGLVSTVGDLERWDAAVRQPGIFTPASLAQMFTPNGFPQSFGTYAEGWVDATLDGHRYIWHDGELDGYMTMNATFPDDGIDIIILTNRDLGNGPYFIVPAIFPIALTLPPSAAKH